jgi:hypothetical protein
MEAASRKVCREEERERGVINLLGPPVRVLSQLE